MRWFAGKSSSVSELKDVRFSVSLGGKTEKVSVMMAATHAKHMVEHF